MNNDIVKTGNFENILFDYSLYFIIKNYFCPLGISYDINYADRLRFYLQSKLYTKLENHLFYQKDSKITLRHRNSFHDTKCQS